MQTIGWQLFIVKRFDHFLFTSAALAVLDDYIRVCVTNRKRSDTASEGGLGLITAHNDLCAATVRTYVVHYDGENWTFGEVWKRVEEQK